MKISLLRNSHSRQSRATRTFLMLSITFAAKLRIDCARMLVSLALASPMLLPGASVPPQTTDAIQPAHRMTSHYKRPSLDGQVDVLVRYLDLNQDQRSSLKNILLQRQQEILRMRLAPSSDRNSPSDRFRAIEDRTVERIRATLNEEQRKKYDPIGVRRSAPAAQQSNVEDWMKTAGPR
jgi:hypothetical protein